MPAMRYRHVPRLGWAISEIGHGLWGMGGWTGSDDAEPAAALDRAVERGCNFFDTAMAYGNGRSEAPRLDASMLSERRRFRWDRMPDARP
jgi:aryl-alcohol dehydrogenase-like predicted oxidoreductase